MLTTWRALRSWRKINYRRTDSLLAAEFLHGLYQRHNPFLNPFRFANTAVVFTPWQASSYAPGEEWDRLALRFGKRFLVETDRTCAELFELLANDRPRSRTLARELERLSLPDLSDTALCDLLVRLQHVPLGEIYEVNLVQVEHALHAALRLVIAEQMPTASVDQLLAEASVSTEPTVAEDTDAAFLDIVARARHDSETDPSRYRQDLEVLVATHAEVGSAYGASTVTYEGLVSRFRQYLSLPEDDARLRGVVGGRPADRAAADLLERDPSTSRLLAALRRTGEVRDRNKQLLGTITRHRPALLGEIARRRRVPKGHLRLYLLEEVLRLMEDGAEVPAPVIEHRSREGVLFVRAESMMPTNHGTHLNLPRPAASGRTIAAGTLRGLCASSGIHTGPARLVTSAADLERMQIGDVLVAAGTDFDLILLLRMAGAIVTEEGGLLSHAAVVARELGTPCLIGVGSATAVLTDGELVTVDADRGLLIRSATPDAVTTAAPGDRVLGEHEILVPLSNELPLERRGGKASGLLTLIDAGLPVPDPLLVVPTEICGRVQSDLREADRTSAWRLGQAIAERFAGMRVSLRSSSVAEDTSEGTAAGIYHSEVGVAARPERLVEAIERVLASRGGERARAYHADAAGSALAILVSPYSVFEFQGTAASHSPWDPAHVLVEYFSSDGTGGAPDSGGDIVHFPHHQLAAASAEPSFAHIYRDLADVARACLALAARMGGPVEVEWGVAEHRVVFLQVRRLVADSARAVTHERG